MRKSPGQAPGSGLRPLSGPPHAICPRGQRCPIDSLAVTAVSVSALSHTGPPATPRTDCFRSLDFNYFKQERLLVARGSTLERAVWLLHEVTRRDAGHRAGPRGGLVAILPASAVTCPQKQAGCGAEGLTEGHGARRAHHPADRSGARGGGVTFSSPIVSPPPRPGRLEP